MLWNSAATDAEEYLQSSGYEQRPVTTGFERI